MERLETLWRGLRGQNWCPPARLLVLDPGDTTGWAVLDYGALTSCGQTAGTAKGLTELLDVHQPEVVLFEEYRLYPWKAQSQSFSNLPTARLIGALELLCEQRQLPLIGQTAQQAKGVIDDAKLKELHLYQTSKRHANDAIRHAVYAFCCNKALPQGQCPRQDLAV